MYEKLLEMNIEELENEIESIDSHITKLCEYVCDIRRDIYDLEQQAAEIDKTIGQLRTLNEMISDLILVKTKLEKAQ